MVAQASECIPANEESRPDRPDSSRGLSDSNYIPVSMEEQVHESLETSKIYLIFPNLMKDTSNSDISSGAADDETANFIEINGEDLALSLDII